MQELTVRNWKILLSPEGLSGEWATAEEIGTHLEAQALGRLARKESDKRGFSVGKVPDEKYGRIGSYARALQLNDQAPTKRKSPALLAAAVIGLFLLL